MRCHFNNISQLSFHSGALITLGGKVIKSKQPKKLISFQIYFCCLGGFFKNLDPYKCFSPKGNVFQSSDQKPINNWIKIVERSLTPGRYLGPGRPKKGGQLQTIARNWIVATKQSDWTCFQLLHNSTQDGLQRLLLQLAPKSNNEVN